MDVTKDQHDSTLRNPFDGEAPKAQLDPGVPQYSTKHCTRKSTGTKYGTKRYIDSTVPRSTDPSEDANASSQRRALRGKTIRNLVSRYQRLHFEHPKRDQFSFIGGLVKRFGADAVAMAIEEMARLPADRYLDNPLLLHRASGTILSGKYLREPLTVPPLRTPHMNRSTCIFPPSL